MLELFIGAFIGACVAVIGVVTFVALLAAGMALVRAFVLIKLWGWFMAPFMLQFMEKPPTLTYPIAIGFSLIVSMFYVNKTTKSEKPGQDFAIALLGPFTVLLMGYIVHLFM